jgi:hypothetical protein
MSPRKRIILLILIMGVIVLGVEFIAFRMLYQTAFKEQAEDLQDIVVSQARLIEAVARFDSLYSKTYPAGVNEATLSQVTDAHKQYKGFGKTGEFALAKRQEDNIVFIFNQRHSNFQKPKPIPFNSRLAEPMRLALSGHSGTIVGLDYRGEKVLAAYEPVALLNWGIVAKVDMDEVRAPFIKAGLICVLFSIIAVIIGTVIFIKVTEPLIVKLHDTIAELQDALFNVNQLSGLLPICAYCKKIRDDKGYWNQIEAYLQKHTEAEFSHGICPDCEKKLYADLDKRKQEKQEDASTWKN